MEYPSSIDTLLLHNLQRSPVTEPLEASPQRSAQEHTSHNRVERQHRQRSCYPKHPSPVSIRSTRIRYRQRAPGLTRLLRHHSTVCSSPPLSEAQHRRQMATKEYPSSIDTLLLHNLQRSPVTEHLEASPQRSAPRRPPVRW